MVMDWKRPSVCVDDNMLVTDDGVLRMSKWSVPNLLRDVMVKSGADGKISPTIHAPGKLMMNQQIVVKNESPLDVNILITVTRHWRDIVVSNPNAIQLRDRWTYRTERMPEEPVTTTIFNGQLTGSIDVQSNSVAEPNPGRAWVWSGSNSAQEHVFGVAPGDDFYLWYQAYGWTPPPFSDNANKNSPQHVLNAYWTRITLETEPTQGRLVAG